jgi:hypothetical protein
MKKYDKNYLHSELTEKIEVGLLINFGKKLEVKRRVFSVNHINRIQSASKS